MKKLIGLFVFLIFMSGQIVNAQSTQITGTVTSADDGLGMPGVSVVVKGTTIGASTDIDGKYSLQAAESDVLVFSFVGMVSQEITVGSKTVINVVMKSESIGMDEVVVTAFGVKRVEQSMGYSVAIVKESDLTENAEPDLLRSLQGKVAGVNIGTSTGTPGATSKITIRGNTSVLGDNQPLFVVDGVPYSNNTLGTTDANVNGGQFASGISTLDPNEIASMEVLKGAAAAALYGSRAANGVILITTKSGKDSGFSRKGFEISVKGSIGFEKISNLPDYQNKYGNGVNFEYANANGSWGPAFSTLDSIPTYPTYLTAYPDKYGDKIPYQAYPNNVEDLFDTGIVRETSVNVSHGGESSNFNLTLSELNHDGYIPFSSMKRKSVSVGGSTKLDNGLRIGANLSYTTVDQQGGFYGNNQISGAASSFARALWPGRTWDMAGAPYQDQDGVSLTPNGTQFDHPLWSWEHNRNISNAERIVGGINLSYEILPWMTASYRAGLNKYNNTQLSITDKYSRAAEGLGKIISDIYSAETLESTFALTMDKDITDDLNLKFTVGQNINQESTNRVAVIGTELVSDGIYTLANTKSQVASSVSGESRNRTIGIFGDFTASYKDYLYLTATARNDWNSVLYQPKSSLLKNKDISYFYPSVAMSFVYSNFFDLEGTPIDFGKIRASWAKVGSVGSLGAYDNNTVFSVGTSKFGQNVIANRSYVTNPVLSPEFTEEIEAGTEMRFFNGRATLDFTWYKKVTTDQLVPLTVPSSTGFSSYYTNIGKITNKGIEIGVGGYPIQQVDGFSWNVFATFTKNTNEVNEISDEIDRFAIDGSQPGFVQTGQALGVFRGSVNARDDEGNLLIDRQTGQFIRAVDDAIIGDPTPDFKVAITNTFKYKRLSLSFLWDWKEGGDIFSNSIPSMLGRGVTTDTEDRENIVVLPGYYGDANTGQPILVDGQKVPNSTGISMNEVYFGESYAINSADEWAVYDGTVYRLRELRLNYDLPKKLFKNNFIGSASVGFTGSNLWYFAPNVPKGTNFDPDITSFGSSNLQGIEVSAAPNPRRYSFDVKFTF